MTDLNAILLSWAVTLSGMPTPTAEPVVARVEHADLVRDACAGRDCKVVGWFPPGNVIYLDQRLDPEGDLWAASIVVHEMVHYLQHQRDPTGFTDCGRAIALEREAYGVQREFLLRYGVYRPVGASMHSVGC